MTYRAWRGRTVTTGAMEEYGRRKGQERGDEKSFGGLDRDEKGKKEAGFLSDRLQQSIALLQLREAGQVAEARYLQ